MIRKNYCWPCRLCILPTFICSFLLFHGHAAASASKDANNENNNEKFCLVQYGSNIPFDDGRFGTVAFSDDGEFLAVGFPKGLYQDGSNTGVGLVRVYAKSGSNNRTSTTDVVDDWVQIGEDVIDNFANTDFGASLVLTESLFDPSIRKLVVGAPKSEVGGQVSIFIYSEATDMWISTSQAELIGSISEQPQRIGFGHSIAMPRSASGVMIVSSPETRIHGMINAGRIDLFQMSDYQSQEYEIFSDGLIGEAEDDFSGSGLAAARNRSTVAISEIGFGNNVGRVQVFSYNIEGRLEQIGQSLIGEAADSKYGNSVSLSANGDIIAIADRAHVDVFQLSSSSSPSTTVVTRRWERRGNRIPTDDLSVSFINTLSMSADASLLVVSGRSSTRNKAWVQLYRYQDNNEMWEMVIPELTDTLESDPLGDSLDMSAFGNMLAISRTYGKVVLGDERVLQTFRISNDVNVCTGSGASKNKDKTIISSGCSRTKPIMSLTTIFLMTLPVCLMITTSFFNY